MTTPSTKTEIEFSKQMTLRGLAEDTNSVQSGSSVPVPPAPAQPVPTPTEQQELNTLKEVIVSWRQLSSEMSELNSQVRERRKKIKALEEVILRIMKKNNIGALDLKGSGGRLLYRRQTSKATLNIKTLNELLTQHLKSETAAGDALKYIAENRGGKLRESLLYENSNA
jgi:hypothetical protein